MRNRRRCLVGCLLLVGCVNAVAQPPGETKPEKRRPSDRELVMASGMNAREADCWSLAAKLAGRFFRLPPLNRADRREVASAIHVVQNKLLSRPTYRNYLKQAGADLSKRGERPKATPFDPVAEKKRALACGLTEDEAQTWLLSVELVNRYEQLLPLHRSDVTEIRAAVRTVQTKLMSRPALRKYRSLGGRSR